jgi:hypothetical protein
LQREKNMLVKECKRLTASLTKEAHEKRTLVDEHMAMSVTLHDQSPMAPAASIIHLSLLSLGMSNSFDMDADALSPLPNADRFRKPWNEGEAAPSPMRHGMRTTLHPLSLMAMIRQRSTSCSELWTTEDKQKTPSHSALQLIQIKNTCS